MVERKTHERKSSDRKIIEKPGWFEHDDDRRNNESWVSGGCEGRQEWRMVMDDG